MNIGIDIVDCARCRKLINPKIFSAAELDYLQQHQNELPTVAGLFAAKEAYFKALGTGIVKSKLTEIAIAHHENGQPYYANNPNACLSISHTQTTAVAVCIIF